MERLRGKVKYFAEDKGFGFISPLTGTGTDVLVRFYEVEKLGLTTLADGDLPAAMILTGNWQAR